MANFIALLAIGSIIAQTSIAVALPISDKSSSQSPLIGPGSVECETVDKYSVEWFRGNTKPEYAEPLHLHALFYSAGMSQAARDKARDDDQTTIWDVWPAGLYVHENKPTNPMRCIHNDEKQRQKFYDNMSEAFALKAREGAMVLHSAKYYDEPDEKGIWWRVEFKTLTKHRAVDFLCKIKEEEGLARRFRKWAQAYMFWGDISRHSEACTQGKMSKLWGKSASRGLQRRENRRSGYDSRSTKGAEWEEQLKFFDDVVDW